jgi:hypothetical protein
VKAVQNTRLLGKIDRIKQCGIRRKGLRPAPGPGFHERRKRNE